MEQLKDSKKTIWPALTLMLAAPLLTEVLPGATRFSSIFVFPIEMCVWGGGALLIRYAVRRWQLGWLQMLFLAIALAIAEECLIQQTSLAPMVIRLKGITYARALGINYVYFLWALIYEPVFVVFLPVYLVELIFPRRREGLWLSKAGLFLIIPLFLFGSFLAWFTWTQIARPRVFHLPVYHPPLATITFAAAVIGGLIFMTLGPLRRKHLLQPAPLKLFNPWIHGIAGAVWAILLFGLVLLGFGIAPYFPPLIAILGGIFLVTVIVYLVPRWAASQSWRRKHVFGLIFGTMMGSMIAGHIGFIGTTGPDLYFKVITNILAIVLMIWLGLKVNKQ
ncbi:MAG: hypothetical protein ABI863_03820 [Ginsengibacter sp.]